MGWEDIKNVSEKYKPETDISTESILQSKGVIHDIFVKPFKDIGQNIKDGATGVANLFKLTSGAMDDYNLNKLEELKSDIEDDYLVPKEFLSDHDKKKLKSKFGILATFEYGVGGDCSSTIEYIEKILDIYEPNNGYIKVLQDWAKVAGRKDLEGNFDIGKESNSIELYDRIKDADFKIDPKSEEFRLGIVNDVFTSKAHLTSVYHTKTHEGYSFFACDDDTLDHSEHLRMKLITKEGALDLVKFAIDNKRRIQNIVESSKRYESLRVGSQFGNIFRNLAVNYSNLQMDAARFLKAMDRSVATNIVHIAELDKIITEYIHLFMRKSQDRDVERD